jgi:hypothetical protein
MPALTPKASQNGTSQPMPGKIAPPQIQPVHTPWTSPHFEAAMAAALQDATTQAVPGVIKAIK